MIEAKRANWKKKKKKDFFLKSGNDKMGYREVLIN